MFEFDPHGSYMMPAHFGPRPLSPKSSGWYRDVTSMTVAFVTDRECLARYLPADFSVAEEAVVSVTYACNRDVDWLAGHGYNLVAVNAAARFEGREDQLDGTYCLVMWENLADPILTGRELQGIPKVYADIDDHREIDGRWHTRASHFGHTFVDMTLENLREPTAEEVQQYSRETAGRDNPMSLRFFPGVNGYGQSVKEPTTYPSDNVLREVLVGEGRVDWQRLTWEQNPTQHHIVNALADLPVVAWLPAIMARGSTNLVVMERLPRVLR
jgi:acetoacetate decarboxylase